MDDTEDEKNITSRELVVWSYTRIPPFSRPYRDLPLRGQTVRIRQICSGHEGHSLGTVCWDSAYVLCRYLEDQVCDTYFENKTVVELGSGTGLLGIFVALCGAKQVVLTDMEDQLPLIRENCQLNLPLSENVQAVELVWGENVDSFLGGFGATPIDCIVCSDVVYNHYGLRALFNTLVRLSEHPRHCDDPPEVIMCYKKRYAAEEKFFIWFRRAFEVEEVPAALIPQDWRFSGISIFRARLKIAK